MELDDKVGYREAQPCGACLVSSRTDHIRARLIRGFYISP